MASVPTKTLIEQAIKNFQAEVPALENLKMVIELELRGNHDVQLFRVEVPGPKVSKEGSGDARIRMSMPRSVFNGLVDAKIPAWRRAFEIGEVKASGPAEIMRLILNVIEKQEERSRLRKAKHR